MTWLNAALRAAFDLAMAPFASLPPWVGLLLVSFVTAIFMLVVFKHTSDQARLEAVKRRIHAGIFEIRLFNDDMRAILRAQAEILRHNLSYLRLSIVPMVWILPPLVLLIAQLQFHYGYEGLEPGRTALLEVEMAGEPTEPPALELRVPEGLAVETAGLWAKTRSEMTWRLRAEREGRYQVEIALPDGQVVTKSVVVSDRPERRSPQRVAAGFWAQLIYPAEDPLPAATGVHEIRVAYADTDVAVFGLPLHWMIWFFVLSIVFAFALRKPMGVTI